MSARRLCTYALLLLAFDASAFPAGKSAFSFDDGDGHQINVLVYQPAKFTTSSPIQFVMHGMGRDAEGNRQNWIALAEREQALIVVPRFDKAQFKSTDDYSLGASENGRPSTHSLVAIEKMFDVVRKSTGSNRTGYRIFGHSAGAQFVHRLMLLLPENRVEWAVAANAGRYTWPAWRRDSGAFALPNGMLNVEDAEGKLKKAFEKQLIILLGESDNDPKHFQLRHGKEIDQQGLERLSRGRNFFKASEAAASELKVALRWTLKTVPNTGHSNSAMTKAAIDMMYLADGKS